MAKGTDATKRPLPTQGPRFNEKDPRATQNRKNAAKLCQKKYIGKKPK